MPMKTKLALLLALLLCVSVAFAQDTRGSINGRMTDQSGSVVPGATVLVTNVATGLKSSLSTNQDGIYQVSFLPPGMYQVEAGATGFKKAVRDKIEVRVADRLEINLTLEVGGAEQSVTITAEAPLMN